MISSTLNGSGIRAVMYKVIGVYVLFYAECI